MRKKLENQGPFWMKIRNYRNKLAGHPVAKTHNEVGIKRTFVGRNQVTYSSFTCEEWDSSKDLSSFPVITLDKELDKYSEEATAYIRDIYNHMKELFRQNHK